MVNIHIVTIATKPGGYLKWLEESCIRNGTKLIILGMGSEWKGYITKPLLVSEFLKTIPVDDIVCVIDAYDVLMVQHIDKLKEKFLNITENTDYKMVCTLDPLVFGELSKWYFNSSDCKEIINAGTYIGYSNYLKKMYTWTLDKYHNDNSLTDDQVLLNKYYTLFKNDIFIDNKAKLFLCEQSVFHTIKEKDDYVFLHRISNIDMVSALILYNYHFTIDEIIELKKIEVPYFINKSVTSIEIGFNKLIK